jgi:ribosomal protein S18 acetylase RimI-like enzyme
MQLVRSAEPGHPIARSVNPVDLIALVPSLVDLLIDNVGAGGALGFLPPLDPDEARSYWLSLAPDLREGRRVLVGAFMQGRIIGCGQLAIPVWPNARHRAEIQKLVVSRSMQGQGVGRFLVTALHDVARQRGRTLVLLHARPDGVAYHLYETMGYKRVGLVPGYSRGPSGEGIDSVAMYCELA